MRAESGRLGLAEDISLDFISRMAIALVELVAIFGECSFVLLNSYLVNFNIQ